MPEARVPLALMPPTIRASKALVAFTDVPMAQKVSVESMPSKAVRAMFRVRMSRRRLFWIDGALSPRAVKIGSFTALGEIGQLTSQMPTHSGLDISKVLSGYFVAWMNV